MPWLRSVLVLTSVMLSLACSTEPTQVAVFFHAPASIQEDATSLRVEIRPLGSGGGYDQERVFAPEGPAGWPASVPVTPFGGDASRRFLAVGTLVNADGLTIGDVSAETGFVSGSKREIHLWFDEACRTSASCREGRTCSAGTCVTHCTEPSPPGSTDRSGYLPCGSLDGGVDPLDGGDAGTPPCGPADPDDDPIDWPATIQAAIDGGGNLIEVGNETTPADAARMQSVVELAQPGDVIVIQDGTYADWPRINFARSGTADKPIIVTSQSKANGTDGGVVFDGGTTFARFNAASWYIFGGFTFRNFDSTILYLDGTSGSRAPGSTDNRFTDNIFEESGENEETLGRGSAAIQAWYRAHNTRVDHNVFRRLWYYGTSTRHQDDAVMHGGSNGWRVDHNQFVDSPSGEELNLDNEDGDDDYFTAAFVSCCIHLPETIEVAFEHNLVSLLPGAVGINMNSGQLTARYNRFEHPRYGILLRAGQGASVIEGNVFLGQNEFEEALVLHGSTFRITNNVFYKIGTALSMNRWGNQMDGTCRSGVSLFTGDFLIAHNSFVECDVGVQLGRLIYDVCPLVNGRVRNNLFSSSRGDLFRLEESDVSGCIPTACDPGAPPISGGENDVTIENNLYHATGSAGLGAGPPRDIDPVPPGDPSLVAGCDGLPYRLSPGSAALDRAMILDPPVTTDLDGDSRPGESGNDVGADQFTE